MVWFTLPTLCPGERRHSGNDTTGKTTHNVTNEIGMQPEKFQSSTFRARLAQRLEERGLTQLALAKASGLSHATVSNYLRGARTSPRAEEVLALARVLEVRMEWLLGVGGEQDIGEEPPVRADTPKPAPVCAVPEGELRDLARRLREEADRLESHCPSVPPRRKRVFSKSTAPPSTDATPPR